MADMIRRKPKSLVPRIFPEVDEPFRKSWGRPFWGATGRERSAESGEWAPQVDLYETEGELVVKAELPDVTREDIEILCEGRNLALRAERKKDEEVADEGYYRRERVYGHFERLTQLPSDIDEESVTAKFENGVLEIRATKRSPGPRGHKIDVA